MTMNSETEVLQTAAATAFFIGYAVPLCLLIGWYPTDVLLWLVVVEVVLFMSIYVFFSVLNKPNVFLEDTCNQSPIIQFVGFSLKAYAVTATIFLGVLLERYHSTSSHGHAYILFVFAAITRIVFFSFMQVCMKSETAQATTQAIVIEKPKEKNMDISMSM